MYGLDLVFKRTKIRMYGLGLVFNLTKISSALGQDKTVQYSTLFSF